MSMPSRPLSRRAALPRRQAIAYAAAALAPVLCAMLLGTWAVLPNLGWYATLHRPSFRPPGWLDGPVWALLHLLMAWAFFRVLRRPDWMPDRPAAIRAFLVQIGLDVLWPFAFFAARSPKLGFAAILALLVAVVVCGRRFGQVERVAGWCLVPYGFWIGFAALLNLSIAIRN
ncbi:MAG TPA: TspO/MBR family protein [Lichenihabitans sp.]|nr:TspO/MBR family protein [Lichenihabitans sp.]